MSANAIGRYILVERLGRGGMAEVWKARTEGPSGFQKSLALKTITPELALHPGFVEMFASEARLNARLVHPNIVQVFDFGTTETKQSYIAMELIDGFSVAQLQRRLLAKGSRIPYEMALYILVECCKGLAYAHDAKADDGSPLALVHRDLSPQNVLVGSTGDVKIADFGIAKIAGAVSWTAPGAVRGKLAYMSPEQSRAEALDRRSDLFALGVVAWELFSGKALFDGRDAEILTRVSRFEVTPALLEQVPVAVRPILRSLLHPIRDQRTADAGEVETALASLAGVTGLRQSREGLSSVVQKLLVEERGEVSAPPADSTLVVEHRSPAPRPKRGCRGAASQAALLVALIATWLALRAR